MGSSRSLRREGSSDRATDDTVLEDGFKLGLATCRLLRLLWLLCVRFCVEEDDDDVFPDCQNGQSQKGLTSECDLWWSARAIVSPELETWRAEIATSVRPSVGEIANVRIGEFKDDDATPADSNNIVGLGTWKSLS